MMLNASVLLHFQPISNPVTGEIFCVEALGRLQKESGQVLYPGEFFHQMTALESAQFDIAVITKCLRLGATWHQQQITTKISFNINGICKANSNSLLKLIRAINNLIKQGKISAEQFIIEISEQTAFRCNYRARAYLNALRSMGFLIAIDDLGAEHSTLERLCILNSDIIKLDISVARQLLEPSTKYNTLSLIQALGVYCKLTKQKLIVEGIESVAQHKSLVDISEFEGLAQGFFYSRPQPISDIEPYLAASSA